MKKTEIFSGEYEPYDFDTILSNGYYLKYKVYEEEGTHDLLQSLTLRKGNQDIKVLNETSYPMLHKNLGYIGADFDSSFVFVQSFGSGNPHYFQLIEKGNGNEIVNGTLVDVERKEQIILYIEDEHRDTEKLKIFDTKKNKVIVINDFKNSKCVNEEIGGLRNCIEIDTVTSTQVVLKIDNHKEKIIKKYKR